MTHRRDAGLRRFATKPLALALALAAGACRAERSGALPAEFLGRWYATRTSGGITGMGSGEPASGSIVIRAEGAIDRLEDDGTLAGTTRFSAARGPTIFAADELWIVTPEGGEPEVVRLSPDGRTLSFSPNAYDAISREYARSR